MLQLPPETANPSQTEIHVSKRKRGGQPGNTNALKHGCYLAGYRLRNAASAEFQPPDIDELIERIRLSNQHNFEIGIQADNLAESNQSLRIISLAAIGLVRLINLSCKTNNSRIAPVLYQLTLETSKALIAKYRQLRADAANVPEGRN
jgi:hypothetical protein